MGCRSPWDIGRVLALWLLNVSGDHTACVDRGLPTASAASPRAAAGGLLLGRRASAWRTGPGGHRRRLWSCGRKPAVQQAGWARLGTSCGVGKACPGCGAAGGEASVQVEDGSGPGHPLSCLRPRPASHPRKTLSELGTHSWGSRVTASRSRPQQPEPLRVLQGRSGEGAAGCAGRGHWGPWGRGCCGCRLRGGSELPRTAELLPLNPSEVGSAPLAPEASVDPSLVGQGVAVCAVPTPSVGARGGHYGGSPPVWGCVEGRRQRPSETEPRTASPEADLQAFVLCSPGQGRGACGGSRGTRTSPEQMAAPWRRGGCGRPRSPAPPAG